MDTTTWAQGKLPGISSAAPGSRVSRKVVETGGSDQFLQALFISLVQPFSLPPLPRRDKLTRPEAGPPRPPARSRPCSGVHTALFSRRCCK